MRGPGKPAGIKNPRGFEPLTLLQFLKFEIKEGWGNWLNPDVSKTSESANTRFCQFESDTLLLDKLKYLYVVSGIGSLAILEIFNSVL